MNFIMGILKRNCANLLCTDTGSLVYETGAEDSYKDFYGDKSMFDFSDYPRDSMFLDPVNKKVIGKNER